MAGSMLRGTGGRRSRRAALATLVVLVALPLTASPAAAASPSADLDQCQNGGVGKAVETCTGANWVNGNLNEQKAHYAEGDYVPYRVSFENLSIGTHNVEIEWATTKSGKHALDYIGSYNATETTADPCDGNTLCTGAAATTFAIPADSNIPAGIQKPGVLTMWGATITGTGLYVLDAPYTGDSKTKLKITFTTTTAAPVLAWAGHIATRLDWGPTSSAVAIPGSPYHSRVASLDGGGGGQDKSLSAGAVIFPGTITITKQATPEGTTQFPFTASDNLGTFTLVDDGAGAGVESKTFSGLTDFVGTYDFTETVPGGWTLSSIGCNPSTGTTTNVGTATASVTLTEGATVECTFDNADVIPTISVAKSGTPTTVSEPGGNVSFGVVVTNNSSVEPVTLTSLSDNPYGNVTQAAPTNPDVVSTTCSVPQPLAASGTYSCSFVARVSGNAGSSHTDTVTASATDTAGNTISATGSATVTVTNVDPTVSITKTANPSTVPEPGGQVSFGLSITNTSPESVTLYEVSDAPYGNQDTACGVPRTLAAGQTITCAFTGQVTGNAGSTHTDTATAKVRDDETKTASSSASATVTVTDESPSVTVTKSPSPSTVPEPGGRVSFVVVVDNGSVEPVTLFELDDSIYGDLASGANPALLASTCAVPVTIAVGDDATCSFTVDVKGNAGHQETNTVTAKARDDERNVAQATADAIVTVTDVKPTLVLDKTASKAVVRTGETVTYDYAVSTSRAESLRGVKVTDDKCSPVTFAGGDTDGDGELDPGETWRYTCATALIATTTNTAVATAADDEGNAANATDTATVKVEDPTAAIEPTAVLGVVVERPRAVAGVTLPRTGRELMPWASAGGGLVGLGILLSLCGRRRRTT
ncbi:MAG: DUF11 domain-containing protein [Actinomycetota bacterium]|nr:DUF11 domain-containing protein [Actinomycetota bacterium]